MELNKTNILLKTSNWVSVGSLVKGTLIFTLFTISNKRNEPLLITGALFIIVAILINIIVLGITLAAIYFAKEPQIRSKLWAAIGFQLANIPIAGLYFYYVVNEGI